jgi:hypothetical protein
MWIPRQALLYSTVYLVSAIMKFYAGVIILFLGHFAQAERIGRLCNVAVKERGEEQFSVYEGTPVQALAPGKLQTRVLLRAWIRKKYVYDGIRILAGAKLYNGQGRETGRVHTDHLPFRSIEENDTAYIMELSGFVRNECIDPNSLPEPALEKVLQKSLLLDSAMHHLVSFGYTAWKHDSLFTSYLIPEPDIVQARPGIRIVAVFANGKAVAVFNRRGITYSGYESVAVGGRYSLVYLGSFDESFKKKLSALFIPAIESLY